MAEDQDVSQSMDVGGHSHSHAEVKNLLGEIRNFWRSSQEGQKPRDDLLMLLQRKLQDLDQDMDAWGRIAGNETSSTPSSGLPGVTCDKFASGAASMMFGATIAVALLLLVFLGFGAYWAVHWLFPEPGAGTIVVAVVLTEIFPGLAVIARATDLAQWIKGRSEPVACTLCENWRGLLGGTLAVLIIILIALGAWALLASSG